VNVIVPLPPILDVAQLNLALVDPIRLVPKQEEGELLGVFRGCLVFEVLLPLCDALEALRTSNVIDEDASFGTPVECDPETLITLLTCCVPNLECVISVCLITWSVTVLISSPMGMSIFLLWKSAPIVGLYTSGACFLIYLCRILVQRRKGGREFQ